MDLRIRDMREDKDLSQRQVAEMLQCDQSLYSKYERGMRDIPLHLIMQLALFYDTSVDYLTRLTDQEKPYPRSQTGSGQCP